MQEGSRLRLLALAGVLQPIWILGGSFALGLTRAGYDPLRDAISELGEVASPTALVWNVVGFDGVATLYAAYSLAIRAGLGSGWLFRVTLLQALLIAASAAFRCDPGCPPVPETARMLGHTLVGLTYFALTTTLPLIASRKFRDRPEFRAFAKPSLVMGVVLIALFLIGPMFGEDRIGAWQRSFLLIAGAWQVPVALRLHAVLGTAVFGKPANESAQVEGETAEPALPRV